MDRHGSWVCHGLSAKYIKYKGKATSHGVSIAFSPLRWQLLRYPPWSYPRDVVNIGVVVGCNQLHWAEAPSTWKRTVKNDQTHVVENDQKSASHVAESITQELSIVR